MSPLESKIGEIIKATDFSRLSPNHKESLWARLEQSAGDELDFDELAMVAGGIHVRDDVQMTRLPPERVVNKEQ